MASIVKRGKTYAIAYYEGEGKDKHQVWESGLSYTAAKSRKAVIEYEMEQNTHIEHTDITVSEFLYEFIEKYGDVYQNAYTRHALRTLEQFLKNMLTAIWVRDCPFNIKGRMSDEEVRFYDRYTNNIKIEFQRHDKETI